MKKILVLSLIIFSISNTIFSQIDFGVKGGFNYSIANWKSNNSNVQNDLNNQGAKNTFSPDLHFGIFADKKLSESFSILTEVIYSREGYKFADALLIGSGKVKLNYIDVPILLGYSPLPKTKLVIGTEIGYLMTAKSKSASTNIDILDFYSNRFSLGGILGLSFSILKNLDVEARYIEGLTSLRKVETIKLTDETGHYLEDAKLRYKSKVFQISLKYKF